MIGDKTRLYIIEISLVIFLLLAMIFSNTITRQVMSIILLVFMIISIKTVKNDKTELINKKQVTILMGAFGLIYIAILYILGIFIGFYNSTVQFSSWSMINYIIPYIVIIISSEIIRMRILLKEDKKSNIIILIAMVILDVILCVNVYNLKTMNDYFTLVGFIIFSSIANNLLFNYIIIHFRNSRAIIIYRLITTLYMYIIPITPDIYIFFETIIRMIVPYAIYVILEQLYSKNARMVPVNKKRGEIAVTIILCVIVAFIIMLVSCKFKYGAIVIGSGSMTGTINKGDIVIYEQYEKRDKVETGEIILFKSADVVVVHRVVEQRDTGDEVRYYTKGDANQQEDEGYREKKDIVGKVKARIPYIGYLTLWVNDIFE